MTEIATMYCHNIRCESFNHAQQFTYDSGSFNHPPEWLEEPYCEDCDNECYDTSFDSRAALDEVQKGMEAEGAGYHGSHKADLMLQWLVAWTDEHMGQEG